VLIIQYNFKIDNYLEKPVFKRFKCFAKEKKRHRERKREREKEREKEKEKEREMERERS
jgi:hypothetical protein